VRSIAVPGPVDRFLAAALAAVGAGLVALVGWLLFRPVVSRRTAGSGDGRDKARELVSRHGRGTLDYFALRDDKEFFFDGNSAVAYAVYGGVCLVSPDPIGPPAERDQVWDAFRRFADAHGWALAVLGAGEEWLPVYRHAGMHDLYVGDEAVVDATRFSLEGGRHKALRQAVNRIAKYGYTLSFHDPARLDPALAHGLREVMTKSRRGEAERGFSMTLGRVFDPQDEGLLLAVASDAEGAPVAFCQFVPAPGIDGYSLDLMRRDQGEHPNGLMDFLVAGTVEELRRRGLRGLGLNFATMRAVLAGEAGDSLGQRVEAWLLRRMSDSMQIESLWKFNAKYDPDWLPRYAVYDAPEHLVAVAMAIARAESFWELPVIGRFLQPAAEVTAGP
jgi:lysyl-tRNA synthetase class 2